MGRDVRSGVGGDKKKEKISDLMLPGDYSKQGEILEVQNERWATRKKRALRRVLKGQYGNFFSAFGNKKLFRDIFVHICSGSSFFIQFSWSNY